MKNKRVFVDFPRICAFILQKNTFKGMKTVPKVTNHLDLNQKQLKNAVIEKLSTAPTTPTPVAGQIYYNTTSNSVFIYDGSGWDKLNDQSMTASGINTALGTITTGEIDFNTTLNMNSKPIIGIAMPTGGDVADSDAATRKFVTDSVNNAIQGLDIKQSVKLATTSVLGNYYSYNSTNGFLSFSPTITELDGVSINVGDRILIKNGVTVGGNPDNTLNGFYVVQNPAQWSRIDLLHGAAIQANAFTFVEQGTALKDTGWVISSNSGTVGTNDIEFTQFSSAGVITNGTGIAKSGNTLSIDTVNGYGVRKKAYDVGNGTAFEFTLTHSLATEDVTVSVREKGSNKEFVLADVKLDSLDSENKVVITFDSTATAPTSNQYRVVIIG